jgi:hypothetical protein
MMEAVRTSETSVDNFTRQYIPEDNSEHHTRRRENFKSHKVTGIGDLLRETLIRRVEREAVVSRKTNLTSFMWLCVAMRSNA